MSRPGVSGCGVCDRSAGARAYLGPRPVWPVTRWLMGRSAGDDSDRSVLLGAPPETNGSRDTFGSGSEALRASQEGGPLDAIGRVRSGGQLIGARASGPR